jgi:MoaA/NifB/PqqE/SkfB family radical SAM enzyme
MELTGLHLLLTYQCTFECEHCFVWGSPWQSGTMTLKDVRHILNQAKDLGTVEWIYFEGGEAFIYYPTLLKGVQEAAVMGFRVGLVTNCYWATSLEDALVWLEPLASLVDDFSISSDLFHYSEENSRQVQNARAAAAKLDLPIGEISVAQPEAVDASTGSGQLPNGQSGVMYRGRAVEKLVPRAALQHWENFTECPYEDLRDPGRIHIDPLGEMHICQGISLGNIYSTPLSEICDRYHPDTHPITGPLLAGGPVALVERYQVAHHESYADACHLCDQTRHALRKRFPEILTPDQVYGVYEG